MNYETLPVQLSKLHTLHKLRACHNNIANIDDRFFEKLTDIIEIDFSNNKLTSLPESIRCCRKIKKINFSFNHFTEIPSICSDFEKLQELYLTNNLITTVLMKKPLPCSLSKLYLQDNQIDSISQNLFRELDTLTELNLENNKLIKIPAFLKNCSKLKDAKLNNNPIIFNEKDVAFELFLKFLNRNPFIMQYRRDKSRNVTPTINNLARLARSADS